MSVNALLAVALSLRFPARAPWRARGEKSVVKTKVGHETSCATAGKSSIWASETGRGGAFTCHPLRETLLTCRYSTLPPCPQHTLLTFCAPSCALRSSADFTQPPRVRFWQLPHLVRRTFFLNSVSDLSTWSGVYELSQLLMENKRLGWLLTLKVCSHRLFILNYMFLLSV